MPDDSNKGMIDKAWTWLAGQPFNNVLLVAILGVLCYGAYWTVNNAVPAHLRQIQAGYAEQAGSYERVSKHRDETYDKADERRDEIIRALLKRDGVDLPRDSRNMADGEK